MSQVDELTQMKAEATRLGQLHKHFWRDVDRWDNSGWLGEGDTGAWGDWCKEKYYSGLATVMARYSGRKTKEERKAEKRKLPCQHYIKGTCRYGDECKYAHVDAQPKRQLCRNYEKGSCKFGQSCKFVHVLPSDSPVNLNRQRVMKQIWDCYQTDLTYEDYLENGWMSDRDYFKMYLEQPGLFIKRFETSQLDQVKGFTLAEYDATIYPEDSDDEDD